MRDHIEKIEVINERDFERLIEEHEIERFMCSGDKHTDTDDILRLAFYSNFDLFDELAVQLVDSDVGFRLYCGNKNEHQKCTLLEFYN